MEADQIAVFIMLNEAKKWIRCSRTRTQAIYQKS